MRFKTFYKRLCKRYNFEYQEWRERLMQIRLERAGITDTQLQTLWHERRKMKSMPNAGDLLMLAIKLRIYVDPEARRFGEEIDRAQ